MLVRLVVITLCVALVVGELQCPGPGRFSVAPGICSSEYYACNRDVNKEYIAYVLSCPGTTLFNERTRKCSSARSVSCVYPTSTTPSGQIQVTSPRREKMTTQQSSLWISRPASGHRLTTRKQVVASRKPGKLPWVTPRPYLKSTLAMATAAKPQKNQWRIRKSTTKKTTPATSTKPSTAKVVIRRTTHSSRQKTKTTWQDIHVNYSRSPVGQQISKVINLSTTSAFTSLEPPTRWQDRNATSSTSNPKSTSAVTLSTEAVTLQNINSILTPTTASPTSTTVKMKPASEAPLYICSQYKTQITPGYVTHPLSMSTSPRTFNVDNVYQTTPEVILKDNNKNQVLFMDSLESSEQNTDVEIVQVDYNSSTNSVTKNKQIEVTKQNISPLKYIRYFYDPDRNSAINESLEDKIANPLKITNKRNKYKILRKKHRQPK